MCRLPRSACSPTAPPPSCPASPLDASNADAVARICRTLDGMPLAIELAAPWLAHADPGAARRAPRRPVRAAHRRQPDRAAQAPDAARRRRLELEPAVRAGAGARPPPGRLPRRARRWPRPSGSAPAPQAAPGAALSCPRCPAWSASRSSRTADSARGAGHRGTGCWRRCAPTAWNGSTEAGEDAEVRDAFAALLPGAWRRPPTRCCAPREQTRWFRVLDRRAGQHARRAALGDRRGDACERAAVRARRSATTGRSAGAARATCWPARSWRSNRRPTRC